MQTLYRCSYGESGIWVLALSVVKPGRCPALALNLFIANTRFLEIGFVVSPQFLEFRWRRYELAHPVGAILGGDGLWLRPREGNQGLA